MSPSIGEAEEHTRQLISHFMHFYIDALKKGHNIAQRNIAIVFKVKTDVKCTIIDIKIKKKTHRNAQQVSIAFREITFKNLRVD